MSELISLQALNEAATMDLLDTAESLLSGVDCSTQEPNFMLQVNGMLAVIFEFKRMIKATASEAANPKAQNSYVEDFMQIDDASRNVAINVIKWFAEAKDSGI